MAQQLGTFDQSELLTLLEVARSAPQQKPSVETQPPAAPRVADQPGPVPVGTETKCDILFDELSRQVAENSTQLNEFSAELDALRPRVRAVRQMLEFPTAEEYCAPSSVAEIDRLLEALAAIPGTQFKTQTEASMNCAIAKSQELQRRKEQARKDQDNVALQRWSVQEGNLVDVERAAFQIDEDSGALNLELQRSLKGMKLAQDLCKPQDDF